MSGDVKKRSKLTKVSFTLTPEEQQEVEKYILVRETIHITARRLLLTYLEELRDTHRAPAYTNKFDQPDDSNENTERNEDN